MVLRILVGLLFGSMLMFDAAGQDRPNILIAISDDQSYPYTSIYGSTTVQTPNFDRVAQDGVLFTNAFVASPGCSPSRAAMLTGRYPWQLEHAGTHASYFSPKYITFPDLLEAAGYKIGYTGKAWGPGDWAELGRTRNPAGPAYNSRDLTPPHEGIRATDYAANFADFMTEREAEEPFYFWYGASEPHRVFEDGVGLKVGKKLEDADVPPFFPDAPEIRSDILDYGVEIEWFDDHLGKILRQIEEAGELENTIVIVTSDNGMAFPSAKANAFEYGIHVPLAISWPAAIPGNRIEEGVVSLIDIMPTILEATGVTHPGAPAMTGSSLLSMLTDPLAPDPHSFILSGRERHSSSRYNSLSYPQRAIRTAAYLLIRNFTPERWPAGAPQKYDGAELGPMHGGYHDIDAAPSLDFLIEYRDDPAVRPYFHLAVDKRPALELYDIKADPGCLINLANAPGYEHIVASLDGQLIAQLAEHEDPRVLGNGDIWETYPRVSHLRWFPAPRWVGDRQAFFPEWVEARAGER